MLEDSLLVDSSGNPTNRHCQVISQSWPEIEVHSDQIYMPYSVAPLGKQKSPDCFLYAAPLGTSSILSRFSYGIPVHLGDFSQEAGKILVLSTMQGAARHFVHNGAYEETSEGKTFVTDCSRAEYHADFNHEHLQINLTLSHDYLEALWERWYGMPAPESLWTRNCCFADINSSWLRLVDYASRRIAEAPDEISQGRVGAHLEEMLGMHLLGEWARLAKVVPPDKQQFFAPRYVRAAASYMHDHAVEAPTVSQVAAEIGISARALSGAFRRFRQMSPLEYLREQRLQGIRAELLAAPPSATVASIALAWGYTNLGQFAATYRRRFGELPSATLHLPRSRLTLPKFY